jgi:hypothetical protein
VACVERGKREGRLVPDRRGFAPSPDRVDRLRLAAPAGLPDEERARCRPAYGGCPLWCILKLPRLGRRAPDGNKAYAKGDYQGAVEAYKKGPAKKPGDPKPLANLGTCSTA